MAQTTHRPGKRTGQRGLGWTLLVGFIAASVIMIVMIWGDNLASEDNSTPSYYRDTFVVDESVYATVTAVAAADEQATATAEAATGETATPTAPKAPAAP